MGKYNDEKLALKYMPIYGKTIRLVREVHMELNRLGDYGIGIIDDIFKDINNLEKYNFNFIYNEKSEYFKKYPSYNDLYEDEKHFHYREGIVLIDLEFFAMTIFIDILNIDKNRNNACDILDIIQY